MRTPSVALFAVLAIALVIPDIAAASHKLPKKPASVPSCARFSLVKIARLIHVSSLEFEGKGPVGNACEYKGPHVAGHYADLLTISVMATPEGVFLEAEQRSRREIAERGGLFRSRGAAMFYVTHAFPSESLAPCPPEHVVSEFGPPRCSGDPVWATATVYSYGALKPSGPKAFVSVGLAREYEVGFVSDVISLNKKILSGQIR